MDFFFGFIWLLPFLTTIMFMLLTKVGEGLIKRADQGWIEYIGGPGFMAHSQGGAVIIDTLNVTNIKRYIFAFFIFSLVVYLILV